MKTRHITIPGDPPTITSQMIRLRVVKGVPMFYHSKEYKEQERRFIDHLASYVPDQPSASPVSVVIWFLFAHRKSDSNLFKTVSMFVPKHTRPDVDNMTKFILDCMTKAGYWRDDSQVSRLLVTKRWAVDPMTVINVEEDRIP